jgi:hypothetical protein
MKRTLLLNTAVGKHFTMYGLSEWYVSHELSFTVAF